MSTSAFQLFLEYQRGAELTSCTRLSAPQDFVTLATWKISRRPPSAEYPWGYGKFETVGTLGVSLILVGGAIGIGLHSYHVSS